MATYNMPNLPDQTLGMLLVAMDLPDQTLGML